MTEAMKRIKNAGCFTEYVGNETCESCEFKEPCRMITKDNESTSKKDFLRALAIINNEGCKGISCEECPIDAGSDLCVQLEDNADNCT